MIDISNYENLRSDSAEFYKHIGKLNSPIFPEPVHFNSEAFNHLVYKNARSERDKSSQVLRFKLLPLAVKLINLSTTYQEYEETIWQVQIKRHKKKILVPKTVKYWGLIAILENRKIKVILRKMGDNGQLHFWSVIPGWVTNKIRDVRFYSTMKGNPEED
jgi:hypothetical protein